MSAIIEADHLTIRFGSFTAVSDVSFAVGKGELFGFLGPNGSGKTTIIKALCGLLRPTEGTGRILGMDIRKDAAEIRQRVGYMSQKFGLYEDLTVAENIAFYAGVYGLDGDRAEERTHAGAGADGHRAVHERRAGQLSGGWKQRLALACAIIHSPEVVFLDEPTAGIDPVARRALWDLLFQLSGQGVTFFVTTHYMDEAERCGRVGYIYMSKLIAIGTVAELQRLPDANPPGTSRVQISTTNPSEMLERVRSMEGVREATIFGHSIHALAETDRLACVARKDAGREGGRHRAFARGRVRHPDLSHHGALAMKRLFYGLAPVCRKEFLHIVRDRGHALLRAADSHAAVVPVRVCGGHERAPDCHRGARRVAHPGKPAAAGAVRGSDVFDLKIYARSPSEMYEKIRVRQGARRHPHSLRLRAAP